MGVLEYVANTKRNPLLVKVEEDPSSDVDVPMGGNVRCMLYNLGGLERITGEVEFGIISIFQSIVGKHIVDSKVACVVRHIIHTRMTEMTKDIGPVQPRHGDFTATHFQKCRKGTEHTLLGGMHSKS
eukprot:86026_1